MSEIKIIATGIERYNVDSGTVVARGNSYTAKEVSDALKGPIAALIRDDAGSEDVKELLIGLAETGFQNKSVNRILSHQRIPEDWRVGEAVAECHLKDNKACTFPWPSGRDQRNPESSPAGADLVGFQTAEGKNKAHRFAFGEVKTSDEEKWPPQVMYGRHGMVQQLEALRDEDAKKDHLVKYLAHRAPGKSWQEQYNQSARRYLADSTDISLFGILVRDVSPDASDLRTRARFLAKSCPKRTSIELLAMYLPKGSISGLGKRVSLEKEGTDAR